MLSVSLLEGSWKTEIQMPASFALRSTFLRGESRPCRTSAAENQKAQKCNARWKDGARAPTSMSGEETGEAEYAGRKPI